MTQSPTRPIAIVVVGDHNVVQAGLRSYFDGHLDLELVDEAATAEKALPLIRRQRPDVVLVDVGLPGEMNGVAVTEQIIAGCPDTAVVMITDTCPTAQLRRAVQAGARGFLLKDVGPDEVARAIRCAHAGKSVPSAEAVANLVAADSRLTPREQEVLGCIAQGLSDREIAQRLGITYNTVRYHIKNIRKKLDVRNNAEAVALAFRTGLVDT
jgi:DNA-binding NarL/FixJ family response regulator